MSSPDSASDVTGGYTGYQRQPSLESDRYKSPIDRVPRARPNVTTHDVLWAEMKTLQTDVEQAELVQQRRGFLSTAHAKALGELRQLQMEFSMSMTREEGHSGLQYYRELWNTSDPDQLRSRLFGDRHFTLLDENVAQTSQKLDEIAAMIDASVLAEPGAEQDPREGDYEDNVSFPNSPEPL